STRPSRSYSGRSLLPDLSHERGASPRRRCSRASPPLRRRLAVPVGSADRFKEAVMWQINVGISGTVRDGIIAASQGVVDARAQRPERSRAQHYNALAMGPRLLKAHDALD